MKPNYPALEQYTYLNTPEMGLISKELSDYRNNLNKRITIDPTFIMEHRGSFIEEVRSTVSKFLDADNALTSLIPNFSFGFLRK